MSRTMAWDNRPNQFDTIAGDRREDRRYDIQLDLRWKLIRRRRVLETGTGRTLDVSSGGILFDCGRQLPSGLNVELSVSWPVMLQNVAPLQLLVYGRIVRASGTRVAIRMTQHEFRTVGTSAEHRPLAPQTVRTPFPFLTRPSAVTGRAKSQ